MKKTFLRRLLFCWRWMIYKINKVYIILLVILFFNAFLFFLSHLFLGGGKAKFVVIIFLLVFILGNIINLLFKRLVLNDEYLEIKSLGGVRRIMFSEICDITPLKLKERYILIISDKENYGFLSSMFERFDEITRLIKEKAPESVIKNIDSLLYKDFYKKQKMFVFFLVLANIFLFLASCYNFLSI